MKSPMNLTQRTLAILSATGTAALMALPAFAQAVPTQGVVNNGDINRLENQNQFNTQTPSSTSDNYCAPVVSGGVGGPIDSQTSDSGALAPSSYDAARTGIDNGTLTLNPDLSVRNSASGSISNSTSNSTSTSSASINTQNLDSSSAAARIGVPNTVGATADQNTIGSTTTYNTSNVQPVRVTRQFDASNRSAAVAYRNNGPAGTAGHEVMLNLDAFQERQDSNTTAYNVGSNSQASATLPVNCVPR